MVIARCQICEQVRASGIYDSGSACKCPHPPREQPALQDTYQGSLGILLNLLAVESLKCLASTTKEGN
jgi:hypothetical protein